MGHARIDTTTRYTHLSQKEVGETVKDSVEKLYQFNRQLYKMGSVPVGADPNMVGAQGFEPGSKAVSPET